MAMYRGSKIGPYGWHVEKNGSRFRAEKSLQVVNHSPDGFSWGYRGSGPAQLALALLIDVGVESNRAIRLHHDYMRDVVAAWDIESEWEVTTQEICQWIANNDNGNRIQ